MPIDPATAGAAANAFGQVFSAMQQNKANVMNFAYQNLQYNRQRRDNLADWNMMNEYNSPAAQMARLKAAGLNPNLVYGNGANAGQAQMPKPTTGGMPEYRALGINGASMVDSYMSAKVQALQADNLATQKALLEQEVKNKMAQEAKTWNDISKNTASRDLTNMMIQLRGQELNYSSRVYATKLALDESRIKNTDQDTMLKKANEAYSKANTQFRLDENDRANIRLDQGLRESVSRILLNRANQLRAEAQTANEYWRKQELMNQASLLEKKLTTEELNQEIKKEEIRLKGTTPGYYEREFVNSVQSIIRGVTSGVSRSFPGSGSYRPAPLGGYKYGKNSKSWFPKKLQWEDDDWNP